MTGVATLRRDQDALVFSGPITFDTVNQLFRELDKLLQSGANPPTALNLVDVTSIDSSAVALLLAANQRQPGLRLMGASHHVVSLIQLYGVDWLLQ